MNAPTLDPRLLRRRTVRRLDAGANGISMTPEEFQAVTDWDRRYRYELIQGVVIVSPAVSTGEADPNEELGHLLRSYAETPLGSILDLTVYERDVRVGAKTIRRCDRAIWTGLGRMPDIDEDIPSIIVEFVSRGKRNYLRDYVEKRREYLAAGVKEYWVINRFTGQLHVLFPPGATIEEVVIRPPQTYSTPLLSGFELPLERLLAKGVRWDKSKGKKRRS